MSCTEHITLDSNSLISLRPWDFAFTVHILFYSCAYADKVDAILRFHGQETLYFTGGSFVLLPSQVASRQVIGFGRQDT